MLRLSEDRSQINLNFVELMEQRAQSQVCLNYVESWQKSMTINREQHRTWVKTLSRDASKLTGIFGWLKNLWFLNPSAKVRFFFELCKDFPIFFQKKFEVFHFSTFPLRTLTFWRNLRQKGYIIYIIYKYIIYII